MEGSTVDHSDSDSGESWTLLENHPAYGDDAPDFVENSPTLIKRDQAENHRLEKDEDTDGISIISDSEPELAPFDFTCDKCLSSEINSHSQDIQCHLNDIQSSNKKTIESICNDTDFLGDGSRKLKTYVHRRNKRLSMVLNIIMLGSVITAAGVAIGHMWGAKHECAGPIPSVNKILSNLYKLQEENSYLRNRLRELTLSCKTQQVHQPNLDEPKKEVKHRCKKIFEEPLNTDNKVDKVTKCIHKDSNESVKKHRCKKIFEEPLNTNIKVDKASKCIDKDSNESVKIQDVPKLLSHEKEFLNDISKLKKVYKQNKSWLDGHIQRSLNNKNNIIRSKRYTEADSDSEKMQIQFKGIKRESQIEPTFKLPNLEEHDESSHAPEKNFRIPESNEKIKSYKAWNLGKLMDRNSKVDKLQKNIKQNGPTDSHNRKVINLERQMSENLERVVTSESFENINLNKCANKEATQTKEKKITYAESLRTLNQNVHNQINESNDLPIRGMRGYGHSRNQGDVELKLNLVSSSEDEIQKDDRYTGPKIKKDKKKHDRQKKHKKQKRKNKFEQWEMKGGYIKDFDEFSMTSSQINLGIDAVTAPEKKYLNNDFENYLAKLTEANHIKPPKKSEENIKLERVEKGAKGKTKDQDWYDKRYTLRAEARRKLEHELFGESSPNNAAWYFRRMSKREQCRAQKDNSTYKKFSKQKMNFKMKH